MRIRAKGIEASLVLAAAFVLLGGALNALETLSPAMRRTKATGSLDDVTLKPLFLFDMRGRRDPFMAYQLLTNLPAPAKSTDLDELVLTGIVEVQGKDVALFTGGAGKTYVLRGGCLYDPGDKMVQGIRGAIIQRDMDNEVVLSQGARKLSFSYRRLSKRLDQDRQP